MTENNKPAVLVTGGTSGIGLAIAKAYAIQNYDVVVTCNQENKNEDKLSKLFSGENLILPLIVKSDVSVDNDVIDLMEIIKANTGEIDVFISCANNECPVRSIDDYIEEDFLNSLDSSTWPLVNIPKQMKKILGRYPRYVIGLSSDVTDRFMPDYDFLAANKHIMEILVRYLNHHFYSEGTIFNIIRTQPILAGVLTADQNRNIAGNPEKYDLEALALTPDEFAKTVVMLTSGLMDSIRGQTINADRGFSFAAGIFGLYNVNLS